MVAVFWLFFISFFVHFYCEDFEVGGKNNQKTNQKTDKKQPKNATMSYPNELQCDILQMFHDHTMAGHPR